MKNLKKDEKRFLCIALLVVSILAFVVMCFMGYIVYAFGEIMSEVVVLLFAISISVLIGFIYAIQSFCNSKMSNNILGYLSLGVVLKIMLDIIVLPIIILDTGKTGGLADDYISYIIYMVLYVYAIYKIGKIGNKSESFKYLLGWIGGILLVRLWVPFIMHVVNTPVYSLRTTCDGKGCCDSFNTQFGMRCAPDRFINTMTGEFADFLIITQHSISFVLASVFTYFYFKVVYKKTTKHST